MNLDPDQSPCLTCAWLGSFWDDEPGPDSYCSISRPTVRVVEIGHPAQTWPQAPNGQCPSHLPYKDEQR